MVKTPKDTTLKMQRRGFARYSKNTLKCYFCMRYLYAKWCPTRCWEGYQS